MALLNLNNVPCGEISGMDEEHLDWVTGESSDRYIYEISQSFMEMLNDESEDIPNDIDAEIEDSLRIMEEEALPKSTKDQMIRYSTKFHDFLKAKNLSTNLETIPKDIFNNYLRYFYSELKTKDGNLYSPASLICIRAALFRFFQLKNNINIIGDQNFQLSNHMLKTMVYRYKRSNQSKCEDKYPAIELNDMAKLRAYFDRSNPTILLEEVVFNLLYYFSLRGRETLPYLNRNSIAIETDSTGRSYLRIQCDTLSKNAKASLRKSEFENVKNQRVYENTSNSDHCPVAAYKLYLEKMQQCKGDSLFPKPCLNKKKLASGMWYTEEKPVGKNTLDSMMARLSEKANLSKRYTNHCLRVTAITVLKENGATNEEIATFSGHKNPGSVQRYCRKRRDECHQVFTDQLQDGFQKSSSKVAKLGSHGEIKITKEMVSIANPLKENNCAISINFNGVFNNCKFAVNNAD